MATKSKGIQKVVQTNIEYGMVVRIGCRLVTLLGLQLCPLAIVERTAASVMAALQQELSGLSRAAAAFRRLTRGAVTESYSALVATEKHVAASRSKPAKANLHIRCQVHKTSTVHEQLSHFVESTVSGMVNAALALRSGASFVRFKECLVAEVKSRLEVIEGHCSDEALRYRASILHIFVRHGAKVQAKRLLLLLLPKW